MITDWGNVICRVKSDISGFFKLGYKKTETGGYVKNILTK